MFYVYVTCMLCKSPEVTLCGWWGYKSLQETNKQTQVRRTKFPERGNKVYYYFLFFYFFNQCVGQANTEKVNAEVVDVDGGFPQWGTAD